jgi:hypothetical protein
MGGKKAKKGHAGKKKKKSTVAIQDKDAFDKLTDPIDPMFSNLAYRYKQPAPKPWQSYTLEFADINSYQAEV